MLGCGGGFLFGGDTISKDGKEHESGCVFDGVGKHVGVTRYYVKIRSAPDGIEEEAADNRTGCDGDEVGDGG